jgi:hypothetical protein
MVVQIQCFSLAQKGMRHDKALLKDETVAASSSWLNVKEA